MYRYITAWGRSYYTNLLAVLPVFILGMVTREDQVLEDFEWSYNSVVALAASCAAGVLMSYSQFLLRALISATSFTVVGTMVGGCTSRIQFIPVACKRLVSFQPLIACEVKTWFLNLQLHISTCTATSRARSPRWSSTA